MDRLVTVHDVSERYGCSLPTARKYIRLCNPHMEKPLATTQAAFREWEDSRVVTKPSVKMRHKLLNVERIIVPRKR